MTKLALLLLLVALLAGSASSASTTVVPSKDADVRRDDSGYNSGSLSTISLFDYETQEQDCWGCGFLWLSTCCDPPYTVYRERQLFLGFDLSNLAGKCLQSATLELTRSSGDAPTGAGRLIYLRRTANTWTQTGITWSSKSSIQTLQEASAQNFQLISSKYVLDVPIDYLETVVSSSDKTLSLSIELNAGSSTVQTYFYSKEASSSNQPILRVQFIECGANTKCSAGSCPCNSGFVPSATPYTCIDFDDCAVTPFPCNNGACVNDGPGTGRVNCTCNAGWQGSKCNLDINECSLGLCGSHAASCLNTQGSFTCTCHPGWTGPTCNLDKLECQSSPCKNWGTCNEKIGAPFTCTCPAQFVGDTCETAVVNCASNPTACKNGGTCQNIENGISCQCASGYNGTLCENNIDDCPAVNPCQHGGTCVDNSTVANAYTCFCPPGFTGTLCETDINFCDGGTKCQNGGTCQDGLLTYTCSCPAGYQGLNCEADFPECNYNPCLNGNCTELLGSFSCSCNAGWGGSLCDTAIYCDADYDHATTNWPRTRAGETARGACKGGFQGTSASRPCNQPSNNALVGVWGAVQSPCQAKVCAAISSTRTTWSSATSGTNATGSCKDGFAPLNPSASPKRYCDEDGVFSAVIWDPCEPTFCAATSLGNANFTRTQSGRSANGVCIEGFVGAPQLNCSLLAAWSNEVFGVACTAAQGLSCPPLYLTYDETEILQFPPTEAGQQATGKCAPGYTGSPKKTCDANGNWGATTSPCQQLPGPVQNLTVAEKTSKTVRLQWVPGVNNTFYKITFSKDGGATYSIVSNGVGDAYPRTNILIEFLESDTLHIFKVYGGNSIGYEESGSSISVTTSLPEVSTFSVANATNTSVSISWAKPEGVEWFNIYARLVVDTTNTTKRSTGIISPTFALVEGGFKSTQTSYQFESLSYASLYEAKIVSGKTENGYDIFDERGFTISFETLGRAAPTELPTQGPTSPPITEKDLIPAIAGGVGGAVVLILFVIILIAFYVRSKRKEKELYELQMSDLPPTSGWGASGTSLIDRAGGTKTLTRTHTLTRPTGEISAQPGVSIHSFGTTPSEFGAEPTLMNTIMEISLPGFLLLDYAKDLRIQNRFGNGGSGVVYRAVLLDPKLRKQHGVEEVAIKEVVAWDKLSEEENMERFHQEVSLLWSLAFHRNIATLIGYTDSPPTIVTKLYETDLFQFLQNPDENVDSPLAVMLAGQIAAGLSAMHNIGIIHRDVKSANVLLETIPTENGMLLNACLCDFGLARVSAQSRLFNQKFSTVVGLSPRYAAPEVFARSHLPTLVPDPEEEKKADVFAFGVILWELMTLDVPWGEAANEQIEVKVRSGKRLDLPANENNDPLIKILSDICQACWAEQTVKRPSIQEIASRLNSIEL